VRNRLRVSRVDSTNSLARRILDRLWSPGSRPPELSIQALEQTEGRGRLGRRWESAPGRGVYVSMLCAPGADSLPLLPLAVGVGIVEALAGFGCQARLKWPNDVQVDGRKLGGILIESVRGRDGGVAAILGFGVNHGHTREELPIVRSTSLRLEIDPLPSLDTVTDALIVGVQAELRAYQAEAVRGQRLNEYGQTILSAFQEVENALIQETKQVERISVINEQVTLAERTNGQLRIEYLNGSIPYLDVLVALNQEQQLRRDLISATATLLEIRVSLYRALAGGFTTEREIREEES